MLRACVAKVPQNVLPETLLPPLGRPQSLPATISAETSKSPFWSPGMLILAAPGDRVLNPPSKHRAGRATRVTRMGYELPPFACPGVLKELACHTLPSTPGPAECAKRLNNFPPISATPWYDYKLLLTDDRNIISVCRTLGESGVGNYMFMTSVRIIMSLTCL